MAMADGQRWYAYSCQRMKRHSAPLAAALVAATVWVWFALLAPAGLQPWQERVTDAVWRIGSQQQDERRLIVIDIDERSLREIGSWPWPRATQAQLLQALAAQGASLQILDIVFTDPRPDDARLASAFSQHRPVLAQVFALPGQGDDATDGKLSGALDWLNCPVPFMQASGYLGNHAALINPATKAGHITPRLSVDGVVRHQPAVLCYQNQSYSALAITALMQATGEESLTLRRGTGWLDAPWLLQGTRSALPPVPLQQEGDIRIPWHQSPDSFISLSAADVLAGRIPPDLLRNAWVLVGSSAFGLNDTVATPFNSAATGLQVHAQIITGAMDGRIPYTPQAHLLLQAMGVLLGFALLAVLARKPNQANPPTPSRRDWRERIAYPIHWLPLAALAWLLLLLLLHAALLLWFNWWIGWLPAALAVLAAGVVWSMVEHAQSRLDRDRLYAHLSSYLPAPVAAALALQPPSSAIKASTRNVSVLFADIRNFSAYCEARPPEEAAAVLHAFFSTATQVVQAEGGVIEAFQGDAVLAVWYGNPVQAAASEEENRPSGANTANAANTANTDATHHAQRALQAAIRLQIAMHGVLPDPAPAGLEPLALGIGVESGPAMAGSFGLASRRTHMVMGRTVTIASRLVGMTADLAHPILVGEGLAGQTGAADLESMGTFLLDGMRVPHHVYAYPLFTPPRL